MSCCNSNCNHDPCGSSFNQSVTKAAQYAQYAQTQANAAAQSAEDANNTWLEFNALYLGAFATAPTVDNEGNPLQEGALYFNSVSNQMFVWQGASWIDFDFDEFTPFLATGTTNARNLVTRFKDVVNVLDYGAFNNGSNATATTAAIQAAINANPGKAIYFPDGEYWIDDGINITQNYTSLFSNARGTAIIIIKDFTKPYGIRIMSNTLGGNVFGVNIINLHITRSASSAYQTAILADRCDKLVISNCLLDGLPTAIDLRGCRGVQGDNLYCGSYGSTAYSAGKATLQIGPTNYGGGYDGFTTLFSNCVFQTSSLDHAAAIRGTDYNTFSNCYFGPGKISGLLVEGSFPDPITSSTTSLTIGTGSKSLTVGTGISLSVGQEIIIYNSGSNIMVGTVTTYNSGTGALVVNVTYIGGSGTYSSWNISPANQGNFNNNFDNCYFDRGSFAEGDPGVAGALLSDASGGASVNTKFTDCIFTTWDVGIKINKPSVGSYDPSNEITGCKFSLCRNASIYALSSSTSLVITGNQFFNSGYNINNGTGIDIADIGQVTITGNCFNYNAASTYVGSRNAIRVAGSIESTTITGNAFNSNYALANITDFANTATITKLVVSGNASNNSNNTIVGNIIGNQNNPNTLSLDWYEENTFTPVLSFGSGSTGITFSDRQGNFTRIGNRVIFDIYIVLTSKGSSTGAVGIGGIPFPLAPSATARANASVSIQRIDGIGTANVDAVFPSTAGMKLVYIDGTGDAVDLTDANFRNNTQLWISGTYQAA